MKKLYLEYFKISDDSKITDKAMLGRVIITVAVMLVCVITMSFTAFAFFTAQVSSTIQIQTATFDVDITVNNSSVGVLNDLGEGSYNITLTVKDTSTATTGYCVVIIGGKEYITQQFIRDENGYNTVSFDLHLAKNTSTINGTTPIVIQTNWGTSSIYADVMANNAPTNYIADKVVIDLVPKASAQQPENNETSDSSDENGDEAIDDNNQEEIDQQPTE